MTFDIIDTAAGLSALKESWQTLWDSLGDETTVFSSFEWHETWWRHYSAGEAMFVVVAREAGKVAGIAPLMRRRATMHGLPVQMLCFMENNQTPHCDFIVRPEQRRAFLGELLRFLSTATGAKGWDCLVFNKLSESSPNHPLLLELLAEESVSWRQEPVLDARYIEISGSWEGFLADRTARARKTLRNIQNRFLKAGRVAVRHVTTWDQFQEIRDEYFATARGSWTENVGESMASPQNRSYFEELIREAARQGWLSLWALTLDEKMIAIEFHLVAQGKVHAIRGHYLPEFAPLSPGVFLELSILQQTFAAPDGVRQYDLGNFYDYKRKWTDLSDWHQTVSVFNRHPYARLLFSFERYAVPFLKRLLPERLYRGRLLRSLGMNPNRLGLRQH